MATQTATAGLLADLERGTEGVALLDGAITNRATPRQTRAALAVERAALQYRLEDCAGVLAGLKPLPVSLYFEFASRVVV